VKRVSSTKDPSRTANPMWQGAIATSEACSEQIQACASSVSLLVPTESAALLRRHGATFSGAFFGAGKSALTPATTMPKLVIAALRERAAC
jgi:hypothetical protein